MEKQFSNLQNKNRRCPQNQEGWIRVTRGDLPRARGDWQGAAGRIQASDEIFAKTCIMNQIKSHSHAMRLIRFQSGKFLIHVDLIPFPFLTLLQIILF